MGAMTEISAPKIAKKRLHMITWGCQMNVYDSARMEDVLAPLGYAPVSARARVIADGRAGRGKAGRGKAGRGLPLQ